MGIERSAFLADPPRLCSTFYFPRYVLSGLRRESISDIFHGSPRCRRVFRRPTQGPRPLPTSESRVRRAPRCEWIGRRFAIRGRYRVLQGREVQMHSVAAFDVVKAFGAVRIGELGAGGQGPSCRALSAAPFDEHPLQRLAPDRLGEIVVHTGLGALLPIALDCRRCHGDDGDASRVCLERCVVAQAVTVVSSARGTVGQEQRTHA